MTSKIVPTDMVVLLLYKKTLDWIEFLIDRDLGALTSSYEVMVHEPQNTHDDQIHRHEII